MKLRTCLLVLLLLPACHRGKPSDKAAPSTTQAATKDDDSPSPSLDDDAPRETGKFSISKLDVSGSEATYKTKDAPKPKEVAKMLREAIMKSDTFEDGGPRGLSGRVTYDVRKLDDGSGYDVMLIGELHGGQTKLDAGVNFKSTDGGWKDKSLGDIVKGAAAEFGRRIDGQATVMDADDAGLGKILADPKTAQSTQLLAIQEIRERGAKKAIPTVRTFLDKKHASALRTAAAETLVALGDDASHEKILELAEDLSRARDPQYVPMLQILAQMGGEDVITYLQAVADGHASPAVRRVAKDALAAAQKKGPTGRDVARKP